MTPEVSYFITGLLEDTDKHIEVAEGNHVMEKQKVKVRIKIWNDNGDPFIAMLHNVLLAPDLYNGLFQSLYEWIRDIIVYSKKGFSLCTLEHNIYNIVTLPHSAQRKHAFLGKIKEMSNTKKLSSR